MKLKDFPRALGLRGAVREYGTEFADIPLSEGTIRFARWLHPAEGQKTVTQESVSALRRFLRQGDVAIDIGAHTGDSTVPIALAVGAEGTVFALEPNPYVFKVLQLNATLNPETTHIVPLSFAAMPTDGEFDFEYSDEGYCNGGFHRSISAWRHGHFVKLRVQGRNLLDYLRAESPESLSRIRFIKIDTEGFDRAVAQTLAPLLKTSRPFVKTEIYKHMPASERFAYFEDLRALGYACFKCGDVEYQGEPLERPSDLTKWRHFDLFAVPDNAGAAR
ncbi:MAG TPA: FkbM family methyltransferase [Vicinamibacterales bacterium]|nr:FkbM family methyltransferase [Vicinamibacterales bacterium]